MGRFHQLCGKIWRKRKFEPSPLQWRVLCEPDFRGPIPSIRPHCLDLAAAGFDRTAASLQLAHRPNVARSELNKKQRVNRLARGQRVSSAAARSQTGGATCPDVGSDFSQRLGEDYPASSSGYPVEYRCEVTWILCKCAALTVAPAPLEPDLVQCFESIIGLCALPAPPPFRAAAR
jgi:hypothetical protein